MDKEDVSRVMQESIDEGLDADDILRDLQRFGVTFAPGQRHADDIKAIDLLSRWYWLIRDVADRRAFSRVNYDNEFWVVQEVPDENGAFDEPPEDFENWCGTTAGAAGIAALASLFEDVALTLQDGKLVGEPHWSSWEGGDILIAADFAKVTEAEPCEDPAEAALAIAGVLENRYGTMPTPLPDWERPWLGVDAPFEPKPKPVMRW